MRGSGIYLSSEPRQSPLLIIRGHQSDAMRLFVIFILFGRGASVDFSDVNRVRMQRYMCVRNASVEINVFEERLEKNR